MLLKNSNVVSYWGLWGLGFVESEQEELRRWSPPGLWLCRTLWIPFLLWPLFSSDRHAFSTVSNVTNCMLWKCNCGWNSALVACLLVLVTSVHYISFHHRKFNMFGIKLVTIHIFHFCLVMTIFLIPFEFAHPFPLLLQFRNTTSRWLYWVTFFCVLSQMPVFAHSRSKI